MNDERLQKAVDISTKWLESFAELRCKLCDYVTPFSAEKGREMADHIIENHLDLLQAVAQANEEAAENRD